MRNNLKRELAVCGYRAAKSLADTHPERINRLFLREDQLRSFAPVCKALAERKRPYKICVDAELERLCKTGRHQGVVAMMEEPTVEPLGEADIACWSQEGKTGIILHDPGNDHILGAVARSAAFFGAQYLVLPERDAQARLTTEAYRMAQGGMEYVCFRKGGSAAAILRRLSRRTLTIGFAVRARLRIGDLDALIGERAAALAITRPGIALALGNEENGLPPEALDLCDVLVRIPGTGFIESLNAAHAATALLHRLYDFRL